MQTLKYSRRLSYLLTLETKGLQALMTSQINDDLLDLKVQAIFGQNDESEPRISAEEKERQDEL